MGPLDYLLTIVPISVRVTIVQCCVTLITCINVTFELSHQQLGTCINKKFPRDSFSPTAYCSQIKISISKVTTIYFVDQTVSLATCSLHCKDTYIQPTTIWRCKIVPFMIAAQNITMVLKNQKRRKEATQKLES